MLLSILLSAGFFATTLFGYFVSRDTIRAAIIGQDLPLTSSNIYSEIQKDLVRPVLISSTMAHDTFLRDWVLKGEHDIGEMTQYLSEIKKRHGAFSSFFVSDKTGHYYTGEGILKRISASEPRDAWYQRVRNMKPDYEINVDPDLANKDALTIFINYRVFDFSGNYIGVTGIGLTVDAVRHLISTYQQRFNRTIYFVDPQGHVVLFGSQVGRESDLRKIPGIAAQLDQILLKKSGSYQFVENGDNHILNVNYLSELNWYLFVEQNEDTALAGIRQALYTNLAISLAVTLLVIFLTHIAIGRYQSKIEDMASTDKLTGLLNRHACSIVLDRLMAAYRRTPCPISVLLADVDHFKEINDRYGHQAGDQVLSSLARQLKSGIRESDIAVRWGGEEFLVILQNCDQTEARQLAEKLRQLAASCIANPENPAIRVSISIGVSQFDGQESLDQTIDRADAALYSAKQSGRDQVHTATHPAA